MRNLVRWVVIASILLVPVIAVSGPVDLLEYGTVTIVTYNSDGKLMAKGSGFFADTEGSVITSRHVVVDAHSAEVYTSDGKSYPVSAVIAEDKKGDLLKLSLESAPLYYKVLPLNYHPRIDEEISVLSPARSRTVTTRDAGHGTISALRQVQDFGYLLQITAEVGPGYSGTPIINSRGQVVGVVTFQVIGKNTYSFAVGSDRLPYLSPISSVPLANWNLRRSIEGEINVEDYYYEAIYLMERNCWGQALSRLEAVIEQEPLYVVAYSKIGHCNLELDNWDEAIDGYYQSLLVNPDDASTYGRLGLAYGKQERWTESMSCYRRASVLSPGNAVYLCGLGMAYGKMGDWEKARQTFMSAVAAEPYSAAAHYGLGLCYWVIEDEDKAWEEYLILRGLDQVLANQLHSYIKD